MKLGKLAPVAQPLAPSLLRLKTADFPPVPPKVDWTRQLTKTPMFCNDVLGCCTIAAQAHIERIWTSNVWGQELDIPDDLIRSTYFGLTGGEDTGLVETDALTFWATKGFDIEARQYESLLTGWCVLDHLNREHLEASIAWFGAAYLGLQLPAAVQGASEWIVTPSSDPATQPGSWAGHAVPAVAFNAYGAVGITWGKPIRMSWDFLAAYLDEAYGPVSRTWLNTAGTSKSGFDLPHLEACMALIAAPPSANV